MKNRWGTERDDQKKEMEGERGNWFPHLFILYVSWGCKLRLHCIMALVFIFLYGSFSFFMFAPRCLSLSSNHPFCIFSSCINLFLPYLHFTYYFNHFQYFIASDFMRSNILQCLSAPLIYCLLLHWFGVVIFLLIHSITPPVSSVHSASCWLPFCSPPLYPPVQPHLLLSLSRLPVLSQCQPPPVCLSHLSLHSSKYWSSCPWYVMVIDSY